MVVKIGARQAFALYAHKTRHTRITQTRIQWRNRKKKTLKNALTPEQIADRVKKLKDKRIEKGEALEEADNTIKSLARALWERFRDHTPQYYYRHLTQQAKKTLTKRKTNMWNAYVHQESQKRIAEGMDAEKADSLASELREKWAAMTKAEKHEATKDAVEALKDRNENKEYALHNTSISSFHDARANLESIEDQLASLHARTGTECILLAVRDSQDSYLPPRTFVTSSRLEEWFAHTTGTSLNKFAGLTEAFVVSGIQGVLVTREKELSQLKHTCSETILEKLKECAAPDLVGRMNYQNFSAITEKYGIIITGWPLTRFVCPSDIKSKMELDLLLSAWKNGTARFERLSPDELRARGDTIMSVATTHTAGSPANVPGPSNSHTPTQEVVPPADAAGEPASPTPSAPLRPPVSPSTRLPNGSPAVMQGVILANGETVVPQKKRKKRSDAGKPRGPRKKQKTSDNPPSSTLQAQASTSTTPSTPAAPSTSAAPST
ncbi:hypothetical protein EIP86_011127 [Pleurotus ostreatoroseus]|nr:hypothetical protein EIP86_011127 [Pleurotus ostreatoroseus]